MQLKVREIKECEICNGKWTKVNLLWFHAKIYNMNQNSLK